MEVKDINNDLDITRPSIGDVITIGDYTCKVIGNFSKIEVTPPNEKATILFSRYLSALACCRVNRKKITEHQTMEEYDKVKRREKNLIRNTQEALDLKRQIEEL